LQKEEIKTYNEVVSSKSKTIKKLKSSLKLSYVGGIVLFIIGLIL